MIIRMKQVVDHPSNPEDIDLGLGGEKEFDVPSDITTEEEALDYFHSEVPLSNPEEFDITVEGV